MPRFLLALVGILLPATAFAQQQPPRQSPAQAASQLLGQQYGMCLAANAEANDRIAQLTESNAALQKQVADLQKKAAPPAPDAAGH